MANPALDDVFSPKIWIAGTPRRIVYGEFITFALENKCHYFERLSYRDDPQCVVADGYFHQGQSVLDWLLKDLNQSVPKAKDSQERTDLGEADGSNWRKPNGGYRLLFGACEDRGNRDYTCLPLPENEFLDLKTFLGIPKEFDRALGEPSAQSSKFTRESLLSKHSHGKMSDKDVYAGQEDPEAKLITCFIFKLGVHATGFYTLALSYNRSTNITHGIILAQTEAASTQLPKVAASIREAEDYCQQPLSPVVFIAELIIRTCTRKIYKSDYRLLELENEMGQHTWMDRPRGDPLKQDFKASTRALNSSSTTLGITAMRLGALLLVLDQVHQHTTELTSLQSTSNSTSGTQKSSTVLLQRVDYLSNLCRNMLLQTEYEQQRVQTLLAVVYNHMAFSAADVNNQIAAGSRMIAAASKEDSAAMKTIAQASLEDNVTMKQIALETKKDSSAMKTIALLTMFFLPGTFVAALFAMPLFNWDAPQGHSVLKDRFNYYWASTLPLTFVVLLTWALCILLPWHKWLAKFNHKSAYNRQEPLVPGPIPMAPACSAKS